MSGDNGGHARLDAILTRAALACPQRAAVIFRDTSWSYREVHERACRLAGLLAALGIKKGDRVALWAGNRAEFVEVLFGVPMLGAIASPLDHWWKWKDAHAALEQIRARVLIVAGPQAAYIKDQDDALRAAGIEHVLHLDNGYAEQLAAAIPLSTPTPVQGADPAVVFFTSGSTGRSKGAVHTHASLTAAAATMNVELAIPDGERTLHFLPLFSSCMEHLIPLTLARGTHIVMSQFDAAGVWETVVKHGVTHFDAVPTALRRILEAAPATIPASLRSISYASERMPPQLIKALIERMPTVEFVQFYGMMEQLCLTVCGPADQLRKIDTVGRPMQHAELYLRNAEGKVAGPGEDGEIYARSPTLFAGYWEDEAATASVMSGGWLRTGDLGRFDADGFLILEGRVKEMIKSGALTVIPSEVEGVLLSHPGVREAAVVGIPDDRWGEAVHAFITVLPGASVEEAELKAFCQERLANYKRPKMIQVVAELPRTGIGKVARRVVREQAIKVARERASETEREHARKLEQERAGKLG
jgi:acyl-CoA synthetase (AMP-forming)/AMP-acid ligase II